MKNLFLAALTGAVLFSCGEAGIGFNVAKEFPVDVPISIAIPSTPSELQDLLDINPPSQEFSYNLNEVGAFDGALDGLEDVGSIEVRGLAYEILDVSSSEEVALDELSISLTIAGQPLEILSVSERLANKGYTPIVLTAAQQAQIVDELFNSKKVESNVIFDLAEAPSNGQDIELTFKMYFDILLKARDL